jgi:RND family efflux transporter MFP subunit
MTALRSTAWTAAALAAAALAACGHDAPPPQAPRPVRSLVVGSAGGAVSATYAGTVAARYESKLGFQAGGRVSARLVEVGDHVRRGQVLLRLDPAQQTLHVVASSAEVDGARSRVAQARIEVQRSEQLLARNFASQAELDQHRLALAEAETQLRSATARQQIDVNQRGWTELVADRDGVVTALSAEVGQVVAAGQQVVTVAADGEREVVVSVPEQRVDELRRTRRLQVTLWARPGRTWEGSLRELAPDADRVSRTYAARIALRDVDAGLLLGMTASVHAPEVEGTRSLRLPLTAIVDRDGQPRVWIVDPKTSQVSARTVRLAGAQGDEVLVAEGLAGGETVVTAGVHLLHAGQAVQPIGTALVAGAGSRTTGSRP